MNDLTHLIRNHIDYNVWATNRLLDVSSTLEPDQRQHDFGTADRSVAGTLAHLLRSERAWLRRLQDDSPTIPPAPPPDNDWDSLRKAWPGLHEDWRNWAAALSDADTTALLSYKDLKGTPWNQPVWQIVLHVVNHSTHHRGQVSGFLRALGQTPPPLDFIAFMRGLT